MSEELHIETQKLFRELFFKQEYTSKFGGGVKLVPKTDPASVKLRGDFYTKLLDEQAFRKGLRRRGKLPSPDTIDGLKKYFYPNNGQYNNYNLDTGLIHFIIIAGDIDNPEIIEELWDTIYKVLLRLRREEIMNKRDNRGPVDDRTRPGENIRRELGVRAPDRPAPKSMTELEQDDDDDADMNEIISNMRATRLESKRTSASAVAPGLGDSGGRRRKSRKSSNKKRKQRKTKRRRQ